MLTAIIPYAHQLLAECLHEGDIVVDATCGNGNDTVFLSELVGNTGTVLAFDIQKQAIQTTQELLIQKKCTNVTLIHDSHDTLEMHLPDNAFHNIAGAIFNLGYLPRSDKQIITKGNSTIKAIDALLNNMKKGGRVVIVVYHGHEGGKEEKDIVIDYVSALSQKDYAVIRYQFINQQNNPPFVIAIERK